MHTVLNASWFDWLPIRRSRDLARVQRTSPLVELAAVDPAAARSYAKALLDELRAVAAHPDALTSFAVRHKLKNVYVAIGANDLLAALEAIHSQPASPRLEKKAKARLLRSIAAADRTLTSWLTCRDDQDGC